MRKINFLFLLVALAVLGCKSTQEERLNEAIKLVRNGEADCVLICVDGSIIQECGRGLSPILRMFDTNTQKMEGGIVVDKVVGRAAAMVAINGKASQVFGELISEDAVELLQQHNIKVGYNKIVTRILNRSRDGLCPLEQSVLGIDDPVEALVSLRKRIVELRNGQ